MPRFAAARRIWRRLSVEAGPGIRLLKNTFQIAWRPRTGGMLCRFKLRSRFARLLRILIADATCFPLSHASSSGTKYKSSSCLILCCAANRVAKAKVTEGAVFRGVDRHGHVAPAGLHRDSIAAILKTAAARAGMNATNIAGYSVRAGMATQAALNGSV